MQSNAVDKSRFSAAFLRLQPLVGLFYLAIFMMLQWYMAIKVILSGGKEDIRSL